MEIANLTQKWTHSHEEDTPDTVVYRPASYAFPPSRGRRSFELRADGAITDFAIGRDDRPALAHGTWTLSPDKRLDFTWDDPSGRQASMKIKSAEVDRLVVSR